MDAATGSSALLSSRNIHRVAQVVAILVKHGWGRYVDRLRVSGMFQPTAAASSVTRNPAERLRLALEELGPTFVKFGQLLSTREDMLSEDVVAQLQKLQDAVAPFSAHEARAIIEGELGSPPASLFKRFDDVPLAAASIAQVHAAMLDDGTEVIVKVQRPHIEEKIQADLDLMLALARWAQAHVPEARRYDPVNLAEEFRDTILKELDFRLEGHNAERFAENFRDEPAVYVPAVHWALSANGVLTQTRSAGHRQTADHTLAPEEGRRLADTLARLFLTQILEHGFFHGDPHPGNVFMMPDGRLCFHDFGIVGRLSPRDQDRLRDLFLAVVTRDVEALVDLYIDIGITGRDIDRPAFTRELSKALEQYYNVGPRVSSFGEILRQFVRLARQYEIRMPREWLLVMKAFMLTEAQASNFDPNFNMLLALQRYAPRMMGAQLLPHLDSTEALVHAYRTMGGLRQIASLPAVIAKALGKLEKGEATVNMRHEGLDDFKRHLDRASNRLSLGLILAAVLIASSMVFTAHTGPHYEDLPLLGLAGYGIALVLGLWWAIAILRSGRL